MTPEEVLALQRTAGNAALARILARADSDELSQDAVAWVQERLDNNDLGLLIRASDTEAEDHLEALQEVRAKLEASLGDDASEADRSNAAQRLTEALETIAANTAREDLPGVNHAETAIVHEGSAAGPRESSGTERLGHGALDALTAVKDSGFSTPGAHGGGWSVPDSIRKPKRKRRR
jgi:hypothetical protein